MTHPQLKTPTLTGMLKATALVFGLVISAATMFRLTGWKTPSAEVASLHAEDIAIRREFKDADSAMAVRMTRLEVSDAYELQLVIGLAMYRCLHTPATELRLLKLPCRDLFRPQDGFGGPARP